ncbi:MAG TPA: hypothetical protein VFX21_13520, partial [Acidimicrobiia bacterium]|nr:hypothetical protein [Acidimicrobiia bacterium]
MATGGGAAPEEAAPSAPRIATWLDAFEEACSASRYDDAAAMLEEQVLTLLGRGEHDTVATLIARLPVAARTPLLRAADADVSTRAHAIDLASLDALERRVQSRIDLRAFVVAVKAQHLLWRGDPLCFSVAQSGLDLLPHDGLVSPVGLFARGRLRLVLAIGTLFVSFAARASAEELLDDAVADFMRAGALAEAAAAQAYVHGLIAAVTWTDVADAAETVGAAAARLQSRHSPYAPFALVSEALLRFIAGDMWSCHRVLESYDRWRGPRPEFVPFIADYVRLVAQLIGDGGAGDAFDGDAVRIVDGLDRHAPELAGTMTLTIAGVLTDIGDHSRARQWLARARQAPQPLPSDPLGRQLLEARLRLAHARGGEVDDAVTSGLEAVAGMREAGYGRAADIALARLARSVRDAGYDARADGLRDAAAAALVPVQTV